MCLPVGFIGGGNMAEAFIQVFTEKGVVLKENLLVSDIREERLQHLEKHYGVCTFAENTAVVRKAKTVFLAVKPQVLPAVLKELSGTVKQETTVVSMVAGYPLERIKKELGHEKVARIMPTVLIRIGKGALAYCDDGSIPKKDRERLIQLLSACSKVLEIEERLFDAFTALAGSGPAFAAVVMEAMSEGGVLAGLPAQTALELCAETFAGTAELLLKGEHPAVLRSKVSSPGGTTISGLFAIEMAGIRYGMMKAVVEAWKRSMELSNSSDG
jgi:pyrroline-5-carboxylate reductase